MQSCGPDPDQDNTQYLQTGGRLPKPDEAMIRINEVPIPDSMASAVLTLISRQA
jgi:hypothetical protein